MSNFDALIAWFILLCVPIFAVCSFPEEWLVGLLKGVTFPYVYRNANKPEWQNKYVSFDIYFGIKIMSAPDQTFNKFSTLISVDRRILWSSEKPSMGFEDL